MLDLFYHLRNPAAAVIVLTMTLVSLQQVFIINSVLLITSLCMGCITLPLQFLLLKISVFKWWVLANSLFTLDGLMLTYLFDSGWQLYVGLFIFSAGALSNIFIMPSVLVTGWFRKSKTKYIGAVWSVSLGLSIPLGVIWDEVFNFTTWFIIVPVCFALFVLMESPPMVYRHRQNPLTDSRPSSLIKPFLYILSLSASLSMSFAFLLSKSWSDSSSAGDGYGYLLTVCFVAVPFICSSLLNSRGVFYQSMVLIFSCEAAVLFMSEINSPGSFGISVFMVGFSAACVPVLIPAIAHRFYGYTNCAENYVLLYSGIPAGVTVSIPVISQIYHGNVDSYGLILILLLLLALGFWCFISAWKNRFVLLQTPVS